MAILANPRHEEFALAIASGVMPSQAYIQAGYSPRGARAGAHRLLTQSQISTRVLELRTLISSQNIAGVLTRQIYDRTHRMAEWQDRWDELRDSIDAIAVERGEELADETAGGSTGFVLKDFAGNTATHRIDEGFIDMFEALLKLGKVVREEMGPWR